MADTIAYSLCLFTINWNPWNREGAIKSPLETRLVKEIVLSIHRRNYITHTASAPKANSARPPYVTGTSAYDKPRTAIRLDCNSAEQFVAINLDAHVLCVSREEKWKSVFREGTHALNNVAIFCTSDEKSADKSR